MARLKTLFVLAVAQFMPLIAFAGRGSDSKSGSKSASASSASSESASSASNGSVDSYSWDSVGSVDSISSAAGVPELNGGMLMLALALTLAIVAIVRERRAAQATID